jgi:hypothetical protein
MAKKKKQQVLDENGNYIPYREYGWNWNKYRLKFFVPIVGAYWWSLHTLRLWDQNHRTANALMLLSYHVIVSILLYNKLL